MAHADTFAARLGMSIALFGVFGLLSGVVGMILFGAGTVDLLQLLMIWNGLAIRQGGERSAYWGSILCGWYTLVAIALTIMFMIGPGISALGETGTTLQHNPWLLPILLLICAWITINFVGCVVIRRRHHRMRRGLCPACAYPIGTSPVCTECGEELSASSRG